jgi:hypothetical protein
MEQIGEADPAQQFAADAIRHTIDDLGAVLGRVDMDAKRPLAERHVHDLRDRLGDLAGVRIGRFQGA